jgi:hypothetical protein
MWGWLDGPDQRINYSRLGGPDSRSTQTAMLIGTSYMRVDLYRSIETLCILCSAGDSEELSTVYLRLRAGLAV